MSTFSGEVQNSLSRILDKNEIAGIKEYINRKDFETLIPSPCWDFLYDYQQALTNAKKARLGLHFKSLVEIFNVSLLGRIMQQAGFQNYSIIINDEEMSFISVKTGDRSMSAASDAAMNTVAQAGDTGVNEITDKNQIETIIDNWFNNAPSSGRKFSKNEWLKIFHLTNEPILLYIGTFDNPKAMCLSLLGKESEIPVDFRKMASFPMDQIKIEKILKGFGDKKILYRVLTESNGEKPGSGKLLWKELVRRYGPMHDFMAIEGYKGNRGERGVYDWIKIMTGLGYQRIGDSNLYFRKAGPLDAAMISKRQKTVPERRVKELEILAGQAAPITRKQLLALLQSQPGYEDVKLKDVRHDTERDERLKNNDKIKKEVGLDSTANRRAKLLEILNRQKLPITVSQLVGLLRAEKGYADVKAELVWSDVEHYKLLKAHPMLKKELNIRPEQEIKESRDRLKTILDLKPSTAADLARETGINIDTVWHDLKLGGLINHPNYRQESEMFRNFWYKGSIEKNFQKRKQLIFGPKVDAWLVENSKRGNPQMLEKAVSKIVKDWDKIEDILKDKPQGFDVRVAVLIYAIDHGLNLGTSSIKVLFEVLKKYLPAQQVEVFSPTIFSVKVFVDLVTVLAGPKIQRFLERFDFMTISKKERIPVLGRLLNNALRKRGRSPEIIYFGLPKQLSVHVNKSVFLNLSATVSAEELKTIRINKGLSRQDVADALGLPWTTMRHIERYSKANFELRERVYNFYEKTETLIYDEERMDALKDVIYAFCVREANFSLMKVAETDIKYRGLKRQMQLVSDLKLDSIAQLNELIDDALKKRKKVVQGLLERRLKETGPDDAKQFDIVWGAINDDEQLTFGPESMIWLSHFLGFKDLDDFKLYIKGVIRGPKIVTLNRYKEAVPRKQKIRENREKGFQRIRLRYLTFEKSPVDQELLSKIRHHDEEALSLLVGSLMWLLQDILNKTQNGKGPLDNDRYEALMAVGIIALYDIIKKYSLEVKEGDIETYIRSQLPAELKKSEYGLRNEKYSQFSLDAPKESDKSYHETTADPMALKEDDIIGRIDSSISHSTLEDAVIVVQGKMVRAMAANLLDTLAVWLTGIHASSELRMKINQGAQNKSIGFKVNGYIVSSTHAKDYFIESGDVIEIVLPFSIEDQAQTSQPEGGINLAKVKVDSRFRGNDNGRGGNGQGIQFHIDPAMLQQLQNAPGFTPVIINIQPMTDLRMFLGLSETTRNNSIALKS